MDSVDVPYDIKEDGMIFHISMFPSKVSILIGNNGINSKKQTKLNDW